MSETTTETTTETTAGTAWDELFKGQDPEKVKKSLEHAREWEKRAKDNADAAKRLAEIEEANKSEAEKAADRIAKAEAEVATVPAKVADALREALVSLEVVPEDKKVLLTASDPEALLDQVKAIQGLVKDSRKKNNIVPREGQTTKPADEPMRDFARTMFGRND